MKTLNYLLLVLLLFLVACTSESTKSLLTIEELSKTYPDSALHVLEKDVYPYLENPARVDPVRQVKLTP